MLNPVYLEVNQCTPSYSSSTHCLQAITKTGGETNFMLSAGVPTLADMLLCSNSTTTSDKFQSYAAASCPDLTLSAARKASLGQELTCCALGTTANVSEV